MEAYLQAPKIICNPGSNYAVESRAFQGISSLARGRGGRLWAVWYGGPTPGEDQNNYVVLTVSPDNGASWSGEILVVDPDGPGPVRAFDPEIWLAPDGRLWLFWAQHSVDNRNSTCGVWAMTAVEADGREARWSEPRRLCDGVMMCKPIILSTGEWALPVSFWHRRDAGSAAMVVSNDLGATWSERGAASVPPADRTFDELMIVERLDGTLWMLVRTNYGIGESVSSDGGRSWSALAPSSIPHVNSRFFIRRLQSGRLLLVRHNPANADYARSGKSTQGRAWGTRSHLTAYLSSDDGKNWDGGLLLDERAGVSYPDGAQDQDGTIYITYDFDRQGWRGILLAAFREQDILAGQPDAPSVRLREVISRPPRFPLPEAWNPVQAAKRVMGGLIRVTAPQVKGAHDAEFVCVGDRAYVVEHDNDVEPGHGAGERQYCVLSIVNLCSLVVEQIVPLAKSEQVFANTTLPQGMCFVPRILRLDPSTLRCYFCCQPADQQAITWFRDFDLRTGQFEPGIHKAKLKTAAGMFDMQPCHFHADATACGFRKPAHNHGLYIFDSFKMFDGKTYVALNNFPGRQNALALLHDDFATFELLGHYNEPQAQQLSESSVNRLPDGTWVAICRNESGNYHFTTSKDGRKWTEGRELPVVANGDNSKPTFDRFAGLYYLGWQERTRIDECRRSVFNIDISVDGTNWQRKYRFETPKSFQYPTFHEHDGAIWLSVTQSDHLGTSDRIMFGKLEDL